jgi:hypothetical protein
MNTRPFERGDAAGLLAVVLGVVLTTAALADDPPPTQWLPSGPTPQQSGGPCEDASPPGNFICGGLYPSEATECQVESDFCLWFGPTTESWKIMAHRPWGLCPLGTGSTCTIYEFYPCVRIGQYANNNCTNWKCSYYGGRVGCEPQ